MLAAVIGGLILSSLLKASFDSSAAADRAASLRCLYQQFSQRAFDDVGHRLPDPRSLAGADGRSSALKFYFLAVAMLLTGLVGISRVYMGVHYPTDVLAGWTAGLVWAVICLLVARKLQRRGVIEEQV